MLSTDGPKIILLDLNNTLSANMRQVMGGRNLPFSRRIRNIEQYRPWLVEWLRHTSWQVHLFTVRDVRYSIDTLETIEARTGWKPDEAWFNDTEHTGKDASLVKQTLLKKLLARYQPSQLFAFESNAQTRAMLGHYGIPCQRVGGPADLPGLERFYDGPGPVPVLDLTEADTSGAVRLPGLDTPNRQMPLS